MTEFKRFLRNCELILNEAEPDDTDVECAMCQQPINEVIDTFYTCNTSATSSSNSVSFFMHKTCFELPSTFTHPMNPQRPLTLYHYKYIQKELFYICDACKGYSQAFMYSHPSGGPTQFSVCVKCVRSELKSREPRTHCHRGHNHPLTLVQRPALFLCDACNTTATDLSYICTKCCFCIHESCANAPLTYQCKFHDEHPLILKYSLPDEYCEYDFYCNICNKIINPIYWVYYCPNCRFFAHVKCASLTEMLSDDDEADIGDSNLMHLPAHDEASLYKLMQQCIMTQARDAHFATTVEPSPYIKHWSHKHQLALGNNNSKTSTPYLKQNLEDSELLICDGCTKPISVVDDIFYECSSCNFFLHRSCTQFPKNIEHHLAGKLVGKISKKLASFRCQGCHILSNGIALLNKTSKFDIVCASLPTKIKHEGHRHPLNQIKYQDDYFCKACMLEVESENKEAVIYGCEKCGFYLHIWCALRPHLVKHRWDPHPLYLILFVKNVADHPHQFDCEFCSEDINPNSWFYHCNPCDLSFHIQCIDPFLWYSNIKFGATNIHSDSHPHLHGLTMVLNKKKRPCQICWKDAFGRAVIECSPCKYIVHWHCPRS